jgi:hypothetical protein
MARLAFLALIFVSLFVATNANLLVSSQQPVANQDSVVHIAESWTWEDCGQLFCTPFTQHTAQALLSFQGLPTDAIQIESIRVSPDPPKPGQDLTVTVEATAEDEIEVRSQAPVSYITHW